MRILLADDNDRIRIAIKALLRTEVAFEICGEATDGHQTLEQARRLLPDLVLIDIHMPGLDGLQVARRLRLEFPDLKVLIMSQGDAAMILPGALQTDADGCIDKACLGAELAQRLRQLLEPNTAAPGICPT